MSTCLTAQDLTLLYYEELSDNSSQAKHIVECLHCREKLAQLSHELKRIPQLEYPDHPAMATRMAARVNEQLQRPRRRWLPITSTLAVSACALIATIMVWTPQPEVPQPAQVTMTSPATLSLEGEMPDIDFLEDMELLMELELLSQVEGV